MFFSSPRLPDYFHHVLVELRLDRVQKLDVEPLLVRVGDEPVGQIRKLE